MHETMDERVVEQVAFLLLGWLLALLAPAFQENIKRRRENTRGRLAIVSELRELGTKLALAAYGVRMNQGSVDRAFLEWLKADLEGHATSNEVQSFVPKLRSMLAWSEQDMAAFNSLTANGPAKGTMLQRYPAPLLDSRVAALWSFETSFQRALLEIRSRLSLLDDLVDRSRKYFDLTFMKLEGSNFQLVQENFEQACTLYAEAAERLVQHIRRLSQE